MLNLGLLWKISSKRPGRQLYNLKNDTIINVDYIEDEIVTYFDAPKKLNWELINETKNISGYTCSKATTNFRGRKYTAWFTTDIPFRFYFEIYQFTRINHGDCRREW